MAAISRFLRVVVLVGISTQAIAATSNEDLFRKANQANTQALLNLSEAYRRGDGVQKSLAKALELTLIAERLLPRDLRGQLKSRVSGLRGEATAEQVAQAEKAASAWKPKLTPLTVRAGLGIQEAQKLVQ